MTCSIGLAPFPWLKEDVGLLSIDNVIELADKALYLAKREGRNRSQVRSDAGLRQASVGADADYLGGQPLF